MIISQQYLNRLRELRAARLEGHVYKDAKQSIIDQIKREYGVPASTKISVELDGNLAGELRVKGTGRAWIANPYAPGATQAAPVPAAAEAAPKDKVGRFVVIDEDSDDATVLDSVDAVFAHVREQYSIRVIGF